MLRDEIAKYTELSGNDGEHTPIGIIGAYLDGYEKGLNDRETHADIIKDNYITREEAQDWLRKLYARADITDEYGDMEDMQPYEEAINMAISALSAEPCDDCISRNNVIKMLNTMDRYTADKLKLCDTDKEFPHNEVFIVDDVYEGLDLLPPVQRVIPNMTITVDDSYMRNVRKDCGLYE